MFCNYLSHLDSENKKYNKTFEISRDATITSVMEITLSFNVNIVSLILDIDMYIFVVVCFYSFSKPETKHFHRNLDVAIDV